MKTGRGFGVCVMVIWRGVGAHHAQGPSEATRIQYSATTNLGIGRKANMTSNSPAISLQKKQWVGWACPIDSWPGASIPKRSG